MKNIAFMEQQQEPSQTPPEPAQADQKPRFEWSDFNAYDGSTRSNLEIKNDGHFRIVSLDSSDSPEAKPDLVQIQFYGSSYKYNQDNPSFIINTLGGMETAKQMVEDTVKSFELVEGVKPEDMKQHLVTLRAVNKEREAAQKTGYVQGVCESVLAFNTDENRKIMSESAMALLSKKLLSEMNVTKDMAKQYANPETYKALEQCLFAPKQEQKLEQTQGVKR